jgi:hypothetical protein
MLSQGCNASGKGGDATSTIKVFPQKTIEPGQVARFYMDTGGIDWSFNGFCWWSIPGVHDKECTCVTVNLGSPSTFLPPLSSPRPR